MAQIASGGGGTETSAERNARLQAAFNTASTSIKTTTSPYVRAPAVPKTTNVLRDTASTVIESFANLKLFKPDYQDERQYTLSQYGTPPTTSDLSERQYNLPQFGTPPSDGSFGLDGTLNRAQLAEAARLTGDSMFTYGKLPSVISSDVANQLPYNPKSDQFKSVMQDAFGVDGFETSDEFLTKLGYYEYEEGKWEILDPVTVTGYGGGAYQGGGVSSSRGGGYSPARGSGYSTGGSLINWRIGF